MQAIELDQSLIQDVLDEFDEHLAGLANDLHALVQSPLAADSVASAFRRIHTIKGDFGFCRAHPYEHFVHTLENTLQRIRSKELICSAVIAEAILQSLEEIRRLADIFPTLSGQDEVPEPNPRLHDLALKMASADTQARADDHARTLLLLLHGLLEDDPPAPPDLPEAAFAHALSMGHMLNGWLETRFGGAWIGRSAFIADAALHIQRHHPAHISSQSLILAGWWHDTGLLATSGTPATSLPDDHQQFAPMHAAHAAQALLALNGECSDPATIIRDHHVWANGKSPPRLTHDAPHPGALILACADELYHRTNGTRGDAFRRGALRTLFDLSAGLETRLDSATLRAFECALPDLISLYA
ncbi:Hpt domain-containing protein [Burkholderiaceae bacterium DAT-1]|nr:Hpt domain-containing protein [Burkholderiaceae bacterium DAT-1]